MPKLIKRTAYIILSFFCFCIAAKGQEKIFAQPTQIADSLKKVVLAPLQTFSSLVDSSGIKSGIQTVKNIISHPLTIGNINSEYSREPFIYPFDSSAYYFSDRGEITADLNIGGLPVNINYTYLHFSDPLAGQSVNNFSVKFDKDAYLSQVKSKLQVIFNADQALQALRSNIIEKAKNKALQALHSEINSIRQKYNGKLDSVLAKTGSLKSLFNNDISTTSNQILNQNFLKSVQQSQSLLAQLQQKINLGQQVDPKILDSVKNTINKFNGLQEILQKIREHKNKWMSDLLALNIQSAQLLKNGKVNDIINDPSNLEKLAAAKLNLSGIQKLMLYAEKFDVGQNAISVSPLSLQNFISTGVNASFFNKNKYFLFSASSQPALNSIWDYPFSNNISSGTNTVIGIRTGFGNLSSERYSHISVFTYQENNGSNPVLASYQPPRSTVVATFSNKINIGASGSLSAEVSHSATQYKNERNPLDSSSVTKTAFGNLFSTDNFGKSLAFTVNYIDEYPKIGLSQQIEIKSVSNGYYNPGNTFLPTGTKEMDFSFRKYFFKKQLQIGFKGDITQYQYNDDIDKKWRNANYTLDAKWKFKKGQYIGIRYQPLTMRSIEDHVKTNINVSNRLSLDGNLNKKIRKGIYYRNYMSLAFQQNQYMGSLQDVNTESLLVTSQQNITINKNTIFWNTSYTNVNNHSAYFYFNTSLNSDAGCTYQLFRVLSASTSLGYRAVDGWYSQVAMRQSLSGQIGKKLSLSMYIDAAENIKLYRAVPYGPVRAQWSLQYLFKK